MNADQPDFSGLERTLRQFTPTPLPDALRQDLEASAPRNHQTAASNLLTRPSVPALSLADRLLALWTAAGTFAAGLVLALTIWQLAATPRPAPVSPSDLALHPLAQHDIEQLIASR